MLFVMAMIAVESYIHKPFFLQCLHNEWLNNFANKLYKHTIKILNFVIVSNTGHFAFQYPAASLHVWNKDWMWGVFTSVTCQLPSSWESARKRTSLSLLNAITVSIETVRTINMWVAMGILAGALFYLLVQAYWSCLHWTLSWEGNFSVQWLSSTLC